MFQYLPGYIDVNKKSFLFFEDIPQKQKYFLQAAELPFG